MKLKRFSIAITAAGALLLIRHLVLPWILALGSVSQGSVGIIGGADGPTAQFLTLQLLAGWKGVGLCFGAALLLTGVFCLLLTKLVTQYCTRKTSALALGLSAVGSAGLYCFFVWMSIAAFHEAEKYPVTYPASVGGGMACLGLFVLLSAYYIHLRRNSNWKGWVLDVAMAIVYLPGWFCLWSWISGLLG